MTNQDAATAGPAGTRREPLVRLTGVKKHFPITQGILFQREIGRVHAVDGVDLEVFPGETLGIVGETGCGKSTLARLICKLLPVTEGRVEIEGRDVTNLRGNDLRVLRREVQMIFQDPYSSLNPRKRVGTIIGDPFDIHGIAEGKERKRRVQELMEVVGLNPEHYNRFPAEFSGGQRQRIGVARALALPAGELRRVAVVVLGVEADDLHQLLHAPLAVALVADAVDGERLGDDRADPPARVQRRVRVLEDHLHLAAQRPQPRARQVGDVLAFELDRAGRHRHQLAD